MAFDIQSFLQNSTAITSIMFSYYESNKQVDGDDELKRSIQTEIESTLAHVGLRPSDGFWGVDERKRHVVHVTGSSRDGFGLVDSDLDLTLVKPSFQLYDERQIVALVQEAIAQKYRDKPGVQLTYPVGQNGTALPCTRVPIVGLLFSVQAAPEAPVRRLSCDLSIRHENTIKNAALLAWFAARDLRAPILFAVIKRWAMWKDVYGAQKGHLNSFPWKLLLIHYLQEGCTPALFPKVSLTPRLRELPQLRAERRSRHRYSNTAQLLAGFFEYYSKFNFTDWKISVTHPCTPIRTFAGEKSAGASSPMSSAAAMFIEDPYEPRLNCAQAITAQTLTQLKSAFANGYEEGVLVVLHNQLSHPLQMSLS